MQFDRHINISTAGSRKAVMWQSQRLLLSELYEKLRIPARSPESYADYMQLPKPQQDELKDVGGYVLGELRAGRRKAGHVINREVITLDVDNLAAGSTDSMLHQIHSLGCGYCVYSTRKHSPGKPRLRVLLPLDRAVTADEYEAIARKVAQYIDASLHPFDPTTFQPHRLMYWSSCCADGEYVFRLSDAPFISADGILATYSDWHDMTEWPQVPGTQSPARLAARQGDPTEKPGIIGAFCRVYDVESAMERFLGGVYTPAGEGRYTYAEGSTTGGAVLYDNGKFLYSHHATDPCGGRLVNAFDLVRLHRFGDLDDEAKPDTPTNRLPSAIEMTKLAAAEPEVQHLLDVERLEQLKTEFGSTAVAPAETDLDWMRKLTRNPTTGKYEKTIDNVRIILSHDPLCAGVIGYDEFSSRITVAGAMPWNTSEKLRPWEDADDTGARWYLEKAYGITGREKVQDGVPSRKRPSKALIFPASRTSPRRT